MNDRYYIAVSYSLSVFDWGCLDEPARKIAKVEEGGGGTGFGRRDLSFYYPTKRRAVNAIGRFKKDWRFRTETNKPVDLVEDDHDIHDVHPDPRCSLCAQE